MAGGRGAPQHMPGRGSTFGLLLAGSTVQAVPQQGTLSPHVLVVRAPWMADLMFTFHWGKVAFGMSTVQVGFR